MKFIFSFLLYLILLSPTHADIDPHIGQPNQDLIVSGLCDIDTENGTLSIQQQQNACNERAGCYWYSGEVTSGCSACDRLTFNLSGEDDCTVCATETQDGDSYIYTLNTSAVSTQHAIYDTNFAQSSGMNRCPWICDIGFYKGGANDDQCIECINQYVGGTIGYACGTAGLTYRSSLCDNGYHPVIDETNHTVECSNCVNNAIDTANGCECNVGYYGDGIQNCTPCPEGTTAPQGSTTASDCTMPREVRFCDKDGYYCMQLIP